MEKKINSYVTVAGLALVLIGFFMPFSSVTIFTLLGNMINGVDIVFAFFGPLAAAGAAVFTFIEIKNGDLLRKILILVATGITVLTCAIICPMAGASLFTIFNGLGLVLVWIGMYLEPIAGFFKLIGSKICSITDLAK